jgi:dolichol-phosphate mannosyltransferase
MKFSVIIPARNEELSIGPTLTLLTERLSKTKFDWEIVVVLDHCSDDTAGAVAEISEIDSRVRAVENLARPGFGMAVRAGLDAYSGDAAAVYMADASDSPDDLVNYFEIIGEGAECVFGSRFIRGASVKNYPAHKLVLNRIVNFFIRLIFRHGLNDTTNAFKCYRRHVLDGCRPFLANHFNLTVELPLKAFIRGFSFRVVPISWRGREAGVSKLKIKEMGSRYLFIIIYCFLEKMLTGSDYKKER